MAGWRKYFFKFNSTGRHRAPCEIPNGIKVLRARPRPVRRYFTQARIIHDHILQGPVIFLVFHGDTFHDVNHHLSSPPPRPLVVSSSFLTLETSKAPDGKLRTNVIFRKIIPEPRRDRASFPLKSLIRGFGICLPIDGGKTGEVCHSHSDGTQVASTRGRNVRWRGKPWLTDCKAWPTQPFQSFRALTGDNSSSLFSCWLLFGLRLRRHRWYSPHLLPRANWSGLSASLAD